MRFLYVNSRNIYPHDRHIIDGLRENGHSVVECEENSRGVKKYLNLIRRLSRDHHQYDAFFVGFTSPLFVPFVRIFSGKKTIFNATSSQYEANVISRGTNAGLFGALKWWLIDFISFHFSWRILLESPSQMKYVSRMWLISPKKLVLSWSGLNEKEFFYDPLVAKNSAFTVLFRGRFLPESGIDTVVKTAKILENSDIDFLIIGHGFLHEKIDFLLEDLKPKRLVLISKPLPIEKLRAMMQACHISLGQMASHPRLERTLPCKSFESLAMRLPYLSARNGAVLELLDEDRTCLCSRPGDENDLAEKILFLRDHPRILEKIASNGYDFHRNNLTSKHLAAGMVRACFPNK